MSYSLSSGLDLYNLFPVVLVKEKQYNNIVLFLHINKTTHSGQIVYGKNRELHFRAFMRCLGEEEPVTQKKESRKYT